MKYTSKEQFKKLWMEKLMSESERKLFRKKEKLSAEMMKKWRNGSGGQRRTFERARQT